MLHNTVWDGSISLRDEFPNTVPPGSNYTVHSSIAAGHRVIPPLFRSGWTASFRGGSNDDDGVAGCYLGLLLGFGDGFGQFG